MIAKLRGLVDSVGDDWAVVDVSGVGYQVFCSARTLRRLPVGEPVSLLIETHVREDLIRLYGFLDATERDWFRMLATVQGVGTRLALAILSVLGADELAHALAAGDKAAIARASGVGPKLAGRIVSELKDKAGAAVLGPLSTAATAGADEGGVAADAVSALVNLGYNPSESFAAVSHAAASLGGDARVEALIKAGLAELGAREHSP